MVTVSNEMPDEERRTRMLHGLKATGVEEVAVDFSQLAQCVGMAKAESLITVMAETRELVPNPNSRVPKLRRTGICSVNRLAVIEAIEAVQKVGQQPQLPGVEEEDPSPEESDV